jgi:hypothetical protein
MFMNPLSMESTCQENLSPPLPCCNKLGHLSLKVTSKCKTSKEGPVLRSFNSLYRNKLECLSLSVTSTLV